jgi:transcriptional regulator with XRE-family HTH domain
MSDMHLVSGGGERPVWTFTDRLRKAREHAGKRQADMAARLRVSRSAVAGWETGTHVPSYPVIEMWAGVTNVSVDWLLDGDDPGPPYCTG